MSSDTEIFRSFVFELEIETVKPDLFIEETPAEKFLGLKCKCLKFRVTVPEVLVSSRAKTNYSLAATSFLPAALVDGICRVAMPIFCLMASERNYFSSATT